MIDPQHRPVPQGTQRDDLGFASSVDCFCWQNLLAETVGIAMGWTKGPTKLNNILNLDGASFGEWERYVRFAVQYELGVCVMCPSFLGIFHKSRLQRNPAFKQHLGSVARARCG